VAGVRTVTGTLFSDSNSPQDLSIIFYNGVSFSLSVPFKLLKRGDPFPLFLKSLTSYVDGSVAVEVQMGNSPVSISAPKLVVVFGFGSASRTVYNTSATLSPGAVFSQFIVQFLLMEFPRDIASPTAAQPVSVPLMIVFSDNAIVTIGNVTYYHAPSMSITSMFPSEGSSPGFFLQLVVENLPPSLAPSDASRLVVLVCSSDFIAVPSSRSLLPSYYGFVSTLNTVYLQLMRALWTALLEIASYPGKYLSSSV